MKDLEKEVLKHLKTGIVFKRNIPDKLKPIVRGLMVEFAEEQVKAALIEAAENARVLSWGQPIASNSIEVDKESILSLIPKEEINTKE